jgi:hypothetical protein
MFLDFESEVVAVILLNNCTVETSRPVTKLFLKPEELFP